MAIGLAYTLGPRCSTAVCCLFAKATGASGGGGAVIGGGGGGTCIFCTGVEVGAVGAGEAAGVPPGGPILTNEN